ncbi:hypothetical protein FRC08_014920 [Ceratobasidium sp. 394]|nr:hypothetical protein FRC08_014920 [Ceratobasidium sp. 394]
MRYLQYLALVPSLVLGGSIPGPIVSTRSGTLYQGLRNATAGQDYFLGIRFAQPPVGPLRFKAPVPWTPPTGTKVVNATRLGDSCEQAVEYSSNTISEDCLTLNIWKPTKVSGKLPVMVWIHGGGYYIGESARYPGTFLLERAAKIGKPVIYVALNYRFGLYGFPPGQAAADAGALNLGLKDQRLALEWIQKNIKYFGGDPEKVTLFGVSAGAISIAYQTFYKGGNIGGAFRGMILESGSPSTIDVPKPNDSVREAAFKFIANATNCTTSSTPFECVRSAPAAVLSQANKDVIMLDPYYSSFGHSPVTFGATRAPGDDFFTDLPSKALHNGKFAKVPFISGNQLDEGTVFVNGTVANTEQDIINWVTARFPGLNFGVSNITAVKELLKYYPNAQAAGSPYNTGNETFGQGAQYKRFASIVGDVAFQAPRRDHLKTANKFGVKTWSYMMSEPPLDFYPLYGVAHGAEVPFVMQTASISKPEVPTAVVGLQEAIGDYWINFAYNLDPNSKDKPHCPYWPPYGPTKTTLQLLSSNITTFKDLNRTTATDFIINNPSLYK